MALVQHDADLWSAEHQFGWQAGLIPIPVRMTVIRLGDGQLILHSPVPISPQIREELDRPRPRWLHRRFRDARQICGSGVAELPVCSALGRAQRSAAAKVALLPHFARRPAARRVGGPSRESSRTRLSPPRGASLPSVVADPGSDRLVLQHPALVLPRRAHVLPGERHVAVLRAEPNHSPDRSVRSCDPPALARARAPVGLRAHRSRTRRCHRARRARRNPRGLAELACLLSDNSLRRIVDSSVHLTSIAFWRHDSVAGSGPVCALAGR